MVKIIELVSKYPSERGDHEQFSGFQSGRDNSLTKSGQIVFICSSDFFDKSVHMKPFEHTRYLMGGFADKVFSDSAVTKAADVEFAPNNRFKQVQIVAVKEVEAAIAATIVADRLSNLFDVFLRGAGVVDGRDEIDIAAIGRGHQFGKHIQTVDVFLQRRKLYLAGAVAVFHPAVVFKKGYVIDRCFDTQHKTVFVVHFDGHRSHVMFNACSLDTGAEVVAHFILITAMKTSAQKGCDIVGLDSMYGRSDQFIVDGGKVALTFENNVGGVFGLHDAPMVAILEILDDGTVAAGVGIEYSVNAFDIDVVGQFLRLVKVFDAHKAVINHRCVDAFIEKLGSQFVMAVEIELEAKRRPGRHSEITQPQLGVDKIEVVMQTLAAVVFKEGFLGLLVMPRLIARTRLHGREDMHKAWMPSAVNKNILYALFLAKILFTDEVDGKAVLCGNHFSILPYLFSQRQRPLGIVENTDVVECQKPRHSLGIADTGNGAGQNNTVKAGGNTFDLITMSFDEIWHARSFQYNCIRQLSKKRRAA